MQPIYTTRRGAMNTTTFASTSTYARNSNTVRLTKKKLGPITQGILIFLLMLGFGLIYVIQSTKASAYDYAISDIETQIDDMTAKKDDLAVEKARLNSIATAKNSTVAASMEDATVTGYVAE